jgi:hypothetical protein
LQVPEAQPARRAGEPIDTAYKQAMTEPITRRADRDSRACKQVALTPYSGQLSADVGLRITDRNNTPSPGDPGAATVQDGSFPVTATCAGGSCSVATTANALMPGSVLEGKRAIWQLGQIKVYDGGADGVASTTGDNTLFMDQGVFVP